MPECQKCGENWTWKQTIKKSFTLDTRMICPYCHETQFISKRSRKRSSAFTFLIPLVLLLNIFWHPTLWTIVIMLLVLIILMVSYPYWLELSNEENLPFSE
ncbi:TIGR04104 family putative zinc finger protein [Oceanobacillus sp. 1P07AA]|uniref:TIGR04104 family putative zinc finger protein n=1 Tax=Oceanobacillus sp. 1P07AA TaxID=3132293 RepID=UPI0039A4C208